MSKQFRISGTVVEAGTRRPLPGLEARAYDKDLIFDDLLGTAVTDDDGRFEMTYSESDFREVFERSPDLYFVIRERQRGDVVYITAARTNWRVSDHEVVEIEIPGHKIPHAAKGLQFVDSQGRPRTEFEPAESLLVSVADLPPNESVTFRLVDDEGREVVTASVPSDRYGRVEPTVVWPDMGIGDPEDGGPYASRTVEEAVSVLAGRRFSLEVLVGRSTLTRADVHFAATLRQPRLLPVSREGVLSRGLLRGEDGLRIQGRNLPAGALFDIYLVERQFDWRPGDPIVPVRDADGSEVMRRVGLDAGQTEFTIELWSADRVRPGSYDFIARQVRPHEYRAAERSLRESDLVSDRLLTTIVVRDDVYRVKPVLLGCVNSPDIAGRRLPSSPYFKFTNNFPVGTDVYAALDPGGYMPNQVGKKVRFYVVQNKSAAQWSADTSLVDVSGTISEIITSSGCINGNKTLVWSNPTQPGKYDLVADFGNNAADPASFVADDSYDAPLDMIDGYFVAGFHVTADPSQTGSFAVGSTSFSEPAVTIPATGVWHPTLGTSGDTASGTLSLPMAAEVRYPADTAGPDVPVSTAESSYPVVVMMHGQHTTADPSWLGYNYLLDHLASHGFIAVSIDCAAINAFGGMQDTRAHAMLEHLSLLQTKNTNPGLFQGKIDLTRIGIMGHSRGGDGVVQTEIYNQSLGLGWNIKAIVALAPTDFSGTSPSPLNLTTSKFLCVYGSNDGDVAGWAGATGYTGTGFRFYDRATVEKSMIFIYGATHNRFNTEWGTESAVDTSSPKIVSPADHRTLLKGYMTAFMQIHLQGRAEQVDYFNGELRIPQVDTIDVHAQYRIPGGRTLDDFETAPAINLNTIGGSVTHASLDGAPQEGDLVVLDPRAPHQTRGLKLKWNASTGTYESTIPIGPGLRNVSGYRFLSFRVSQVAASAANPSGADQDFYVRLNTSGGGPSRAVRANYFGDVPFPYGPEYNGYSSYETSNTKAALKTIRIPLTSWTIKCLSAPIVDLGDVESMTFEFTRRPTGEILIDDIEFTQ